MTATLHKVLAGNGYLYYLRHVAADDSSHRGPGSLADYYSARGESPGRWHGSGLASLGLGGGDLVTEAQMKSLFGQGRHPNADVIETEVLDREIAASAKAKDALRAADKATRLGRPFRVYEGGNEFRHRCADAFAQHNIQQGRRRSEAIDDAVRARIRSRVATTMFTEMIGRAPLDARELSGWVARNSRPQSAAVAGFDITFSPVKSVSALWAIAPKAVSDKVAAAHEKAIDDAVAWLEKHAIYTRLGANGVRQVEVEGIVAARFVHRESRCGDPDLHTHLLIANRVRTRDGQWLTLDAAMIYRLMVTVSEIYNTRLEHHLEHDVAVSFSERPGTDPTKRPIREIDGVPVALIEYWSRRDADIAARLDILAARFEREVGREPMPKEMFALAERATLETRPHRHSSRSWAEQRDDWRRQAEKVLGSPELVSKTVSTAVSNRPTRRRRLTPDETATIGQQVVATVSAERSSWRWHHVRAEAERRLRGVLDKDHWPAAVDAVVAEALSPVNVVARGDPDIAAEPVLADTPPLYQRADHSSVYTGADTQIYTSVHRLATTQRLIELSLRLGARTLTDEAVRAAIDAYHADAANTGRRLNAGQVAVITEFARSPWFIATTNAPAGAGKTTAMRVLADAWRTDGGTVLGLAPTAAAAAVLGEAITARTETADKLLDILHKHSPAAAASPADSNPFPPSLPQWVLKIDARTLVILDEHVRLGDDKRRELFEFLADRHAVVRCVGDDHQLPPIEAGGSASDGDDAARTSTLTQVVRFASVIEASASLALREGDPSALGFYLDHQRIRSGSPAAVREQAYAGWLADHLGDRDTVMLAATNDIVTALNEQARADLLARSDTEVGPQAELGDGLYASRGDIVSTRRNNPRLRVGARDWVRNGYRWTVTTVHPDGALTVTHLRPGRRNGETTVLPAEYVREHVRLGYAMTIDSAQGITADTCHVVVNGSESRNQLYVALTRGALTNHVYVTTAIDGSEASFWTEPGLYPRTAVEVLQRILAREATNTSAHTELRDALDPHRRLGTAIDTYHDALALAAEDILGTTALSELDAQAEHLWPGLTDTPAYPALREVLSLIALSGGDPGDALAAALSARELTTAADPAAVLHWRLDTRHAYPRDTEPLPWVRGLPRNLPETVVSDHLRARARLITHLADHIRDDTRTWTAATAPVWARPLLGNSALLGDLAVWRAGRHVADTDLRPTGPTGFTVREQDRQRLLDARVTEVLGDLHTAINTWSPLAKQLDARILDDPWWPNLADKLDTAAHAGLDIDALLTRAATERPLPDDMPAAALWFRLGLDPSALQTTETTHLRPDWSTHLHQLLGTDLADTILASPTWPRLVAAVDHGTDAGWDPYELLITAHELLTAAAPEDPGPRPDQYTTALAWRIEALLHPGAPSPDIASPSDESRSTATDSDATMQHLDDPDPTSSPSNDPNPDNPHDARDDIGGGQTLTADLRAVAELIHAGRVTEAKDALIAASRTATDTEIDILERVATTLYTNSFPVARARLRWAAEQYPDYRALIHAATPTTDPHLYNPDLGTQQPPTVSGADHAARDHEPRRDDQPPRPRPTAADVAARRENAEYLDTRADIDANPQHLPLPEGVPHRYYNPRPHDPRASQPPLDYDLAAIPDTRGFDCVHCGLERAVLDASPAAGRRSDDGLCGECRDNNAPSIPDHEPHEHIPTRCAHIAHTFPQLAALTRLRRDWHNARTAEARQQIEDWVEQHLTIPAERPLTDAETDLASANPLLGIADDDLAHRIDHISRRLALADTEAMLYGPAQPEPDESAGLDTDWLTEELRQLQREQQRRAQLTTDQAETEGLLRPGTIEPEFDTPATDLGLDATDRTGPGVDL